MSRLSAFIRRQFPKPPSDPMHMSKETERAFRSFMELLPRGGIFVDLGANFGRVTERALEYCSKVYAFEPDPGALEVIRSRYGDDPRVEIIPKAIGGEARTATLFRHVTGHAETSSLISYTHEGGDHVAVEVVGIVDFLRSIGPVTAVKMDIEGAEAECLEAILDAGLHRSIGIVLVETHEHISPDIARRIGAVRERVRREKISNINLDFF